jgi:hypothetical protein
VLDPARLLDPARRLDPVRLLDRPPALRRDVNRPLADLPREPLRPPRSL